ncbi:MAG: hypothetical protein ACYCW6_22970, partial [Candidatus Xenobia bacterium]
MRRLWFPLLLALLLGCARAGGPQPLRLVKDVALPGGATRFDYQSMDLLADRLYMSHMGDGDVVVFDLKGDKVLQVVPGTPRVTGILAVPELQRVFASAAGRGEVV